MNKFKLDLHWQIFIGLFLGILYGLFLADYVHLVEWMGDIFMRLLRMIIVPLVLTSIVAGIAGIKGQGLKTMGLKTFLYYMSTSMLGIAVGSFIMNVFQPGVGLDIGTPSTAEAAKLEKLSSNSESFTFLDRLLDIIPTNIFNAFAEGDTLAIIFFAILLGVFIPRLSDKYREPFVFAFKGAFELIMKITMAIIKLAPIGIFGLMASVIAEQAGDLDKFIALMSRLGGFALLVTIGLGFHMFVTLSILLVVFGKVNPIKHFKAMTTPLLTAFSTASSGATMPLTLTALKENSGVSDRTTSFVIPLGATVNMDGTALYEIAAVLFIAQAYGLDLDMTGQLTIIVTSLLASIGAAAVPMAGLIMMTIILSAIGLPLEAIGLILAVDRILDMMRTAVNVYSDSCGCVIIAKSEGEILNYDKDEDGHVMAR